MNNINIDYSLDNIPVSFFDAGNVYYKISLLYKIKQVVLVEVFTGNIYKYHAVNYLTKEKKYLFYTKQPIPQSKFGDVAEKIFGLAALFEITHEEINPDSEFANDPKGIKTFGVTTEVSASKAGMESSDKSQEVDIYRLQKKVFRETLPKYGFSIRESQIELAEKILAALQECRISLCEAEVGTGKTYAYIIAARYTVIIILQVLFLG